MEAIRLEDLILAINGMKNEQKQAPLRRVEVRIRGILAAKNFPLRSGRPITNIKKTCTREKVNVDRILAWM